MRIYPPEAHHTQFIRRYGLNLSSEFKASQARRLLLNWIIAPAIDRGSLLTLGWLKENAPEFVPFFNDDQNDFLEDRIKKAIINSEDESIKALLAELATKFGFDLLEPEEEVEGGSAEEKSA